MSETTLLDQAQILLKEARRNPTQIVSIIMLVSFLGLLLGLLIPRMYQSATTVQVEQQSIIAPLLEGTSVPTSMQDQVWLAEETLFSRSVLRDILETGGWLEEDLTPLETEKLMEQIERRTEIENLGRNLMRISYEDEVPERAFRVTLRFAELFISEGRETKRRESRQAFEFISAEVIRYQNQLKASEDRLNDFLSKNGNVRPGTGASVNAQVGELRSTIRNIELDLEEARIRERSILAQLSTEEPTTASITRETQILGMLETQHATLDDLLLNYRDTYPDVVATRHKIQTLESQLADERKRRAENRLPGSSENFTGININPLHQELRSDLSSVRTEIAALETRLRETGNWLTSEYDLGNQIAQTEAEAAELTRDYEVNRAIYQDLLRHRESARISMSLDDQGEGLRMSVQEPANLPLQPHGLRLVHFAIISPILGMLLAFGMLFIRLQLDGRIRSSGSISRDLGVPVLATIPTMNDEGSRERNRTAWRVSMMGLLVLILGYAVIGGLRMANLI